MVAAVSVRIRQPMLERACDSFDGCLGGTNHPTRQQALPHCLNRWSTGCARRSFFCSLRGSDPKSDWSLIRTALLDAFDG